MELQKTEQGFSSLDDVGSWTTEQVLRALGSSLNGLSESEAELRLKNSGPNEIKEVRGKPLIYGLIANLTHLMALLLWAASVIAYIGDMPQLSVAIVAVIIINAGFSFWQEYRAERTVTEMKKLIPQYARVIRSGVERQILAREIVPGDIIVLSSGDKIPSDARIVKDFEIQTDESILTGESRPIRKTSESIARGIQNVSHRPPNVVYGGTTTVSGSGVAVVFATGMKTQFGQIADLTETVREEPSPLQKEMKKVTAIVTALALLVGALVFPVALYLNLGLATSFMFSIGIIVAFVPEGMLPTVTLSLAMSMQRMARRGAMIKKLSSVETLGCTTVICTDKTGTLTCNEMTTTRIWVWNRDIRVSGAGYTPVGKFYLGSAELPIEENADVTLLLTAAALSSDARLVPPTDRRPIWSILGDPTEGALQVAALKAGLTLTPPPTRRLVFPFDSKRKRMTAIVEEDSGINGKDQRDTRLRAHVKGAPAELLERCDRIVKGSEVVPLTETYRTEVHRQMDIYAKDGLRVLGVAYRDLPALQLELTSENVETNLAFVGLMAMTDPPRPEVEEALRKCKEAGIRVVMITGDYGLTAASVGRRLAIIGDEYRIVTGEEMDSMSDESLTAILRKKDVLFARVHPEHKLRIVSALQALGDVVAVTGDGVNDAPALKRADIGVAMGLTGTDVAKEAADMILLDNNFASIVSAVEEGRTVYSNIRKFAKYILTSNMPEVVPFIVFVLAGVPLPLTVMQILAVDLGTDMVPAIALGAEPPEEDVMKMSPRSREKNLLSASLIATALLFLGTIESIAAMASYYWMNWINGFGFDKPLAQPGSVVYSMATTMTLVGIVMVQVGNLFACRTDRASGLKRSIRINPMIKTGLLVEIGIIIGIVYLPPLQIVFGTAPLLLWHWLFPMIFAPIILLADELRKLMIRRRLLVVPRGM